MPHALAAGNLKQVQKFKSCYAALKPDVRCNPANEQVGLFADLGRYRGRNGLCLSANFVIRSGKELYPSFEFRAYQVGRNISRGKLVKYTDE